MDKPNCYECKFRGTVPGSVHSSCNTREMPWAVINKSNALLLAAALTKSPNSLVLTTTNKETNEKTEELVIEFDEYGIRKGWAMWPIDFDPTWLRQCKFYQAK